MKVKVHTNLKKEAGQKLEKREDHYGEEGWETGRVERRRGGLQIPEVINKSVSSRTPVMIWVKLFPPPPEVDQGRSKKRNLSIPT